MRDDDDRRVSNTRRVLVAILVLLALLLAVTSYFLISIIEPTGPVATPEETGGLVWIRSIYGFGDTMDEQLQQPNDVAIAPDGTIWVTDQSRQRVIGFNPDGTYDTMLHKGPRGSSPEALSFPSSVAVDEDGEIYVGDSMRDKVVVFSKDNEILREYYVPGPRCIAVKGDRIVVGSMAGFVILEKDGDVVQVVGSRGKGEDQFDSVQGAVISDDGLIYIVDQYNNRLSAYDLDGRRKWIRVLGASGNQGMQTGGSQATPGVSDAEAQTQLPLRVEIDGAGRLVLIDAFDFSLTVLDAANGDLIGKYGTFGDAEGEFTYPVALSYDAARDWFAVADSFNSRVQVVRIPDSGGSIASPVVRTLSGPWRACIFPLLLLVIAAIVGVVVRRFKGRRVVETGGLPEQPAGPRAGDVTGVTIEGWID